MKKCKRCGYVKTWSGSDITCPFQDGDSFGENWNCGMINAIREICDMAGDGEDYRLHYQYCDDQKYVTINTDEIEFDGDRCFLCLWVTWYKSRGGTDQMWLMNAYGEPEAPTYSDLEKIINHYKVEL